MNGEGCQQFLVLAVCVQPLPIEIFQGSKLKVALWTLNAQLSTALSDYWRRLNSYLDLIWFLACVSKFLKIDKKKGTTSTSSHAGLIYLYKGNTNYVLIHLQNHRFEHREIILELTPDGRKSGKAHDTFVRCAEFFACLPVVMCTIILLWIKNDA